MISRATELSFPANDVAWRQDQRIAPTTRVHMMMNDMPVATTDVIGRGDVLQLFSDEMQVATKHVHNRSKGSAAREGPRTRRNLGGARLRRCGM